MAKKNILLAITLAAALSGTYFLFRPQQHIEEKAAVESTTKYVASSERFGEDPNKRDVYIIFQAHTIKGHGISDSNALLIDNNLVSHPIGIYRIVESLYRNRGVNVIGGEGL